MGIQAQVGRKDSRARLQFLGHGGTEAQVDPQEDFGGVQKTAPPNRSRLHLLLCAIVSGKCVSRFFAIKENQCGVDT